MNTPDPASAQIFPTPASSRLHSVGANALAGCGKIVFSERFLPSLRRLLALRGFTRGFTAQIPCSCSFTSANGACYIQKGGILTPPAYGTLGNATRGIFVRPKYENVDSARKDVALQRALYRAIADRVLQHL